MRKISILCSLLAVVAGAGDAHADDERLGLDWVFSDEGKAAMSLPRSAWLDNGMLVIYDERPVKKERTLQSVDPSSGRRKNLVDAAKAIQGLNDALEPDEPIEELGWPDAFDPTGTWAAYATNDDIVLLGLRDSRVVAVATTDAEESAPRFSPDGKWLAFVRDHNLYAWNIAGNEEKRLTSDGSETLLNGTVSWVYWEELLNRADRGYIWSPDSTAIAYLQTDEAGVGVMHYVDFEPSLPNVILQRHAKPGAANPKVRAGVVRIDNAETTWVDFGGYLYEYLPRIKWLPDSRRLAVQTMNRPQTDVDLFVADTSTGTARHVLRETDPGWVNIHDDLHFLGNGDTFLWRSERDGHAHLYRFTLDGELVNQVTRGDWAMVPSGGPDGMDQAVSYVDERAGQVYFTALEKHSTERHLYRINLDGDGMSRLTQTDGTHVIHFSANGRRYLDAHSALDTPPSLRVYTADGSPSAIVADADNGTVDRFDLLPWELFSIRARDGFEMPAMLLKPRYFDPGHRYPVVTYVYGGPSAPTVANAWPRGARGWYHQVLAENGAIVFLVDNRSAAGKSKVDANTILNQLMGPVELNDLLDGIAWLKAQPFVDPDRVGIWGWSGGGTLTLESMTGSEEFAAGASVAPVTDWHYYDTIYTERYMKRPQDNAEGYETTSRVRHADQLHGRLLLVHGTYDDNVHPQNSWAFGDKLIEAGITFDMMIYPMRKHGISDDAAQYHVFRTMYEFFERNLGLGDQ